MKEEDEEYPTADKKAATVTKVKSTTSRCFFGGEFDLDLLGENLLEILLPEKTERDVERAVDTEVEAKRIEPETLAERNLLFITNAVKRYGKRDAGILAMKILQWKPRISEKEFWLKLEERMAE